MQYANHKWLVNSPFISVSYPTVAIDVIRALLEAGVHGLDRWQLTESCPNVKPFWLRTTLKQLEAHSLIACEYEHRVFSLLGQFPGSKIIDRLNSTEARILGMLCENAPGTKLCTAEIAARHLIERAQVRTAAIGLASKGYLKLNKTSERGQRIRNWYTLQDLKPFTLSHVLAEDSENLIISK